MGGWACLRNCVICNGSGVAGTNFVMDQVEGLLVERFGANDVTVFIVVDNEEMTVHSLLHAVVGSYL